jgi:hypothetical protein
MPTVTCAWRILNSPISIADSGLEDQDIIDRILAHLREKEQDIPTLPLLTPPPRAPPETYPIKRGRLLPIFIGRESEFTEFNQQGRH